MWVLQHELGRGFGDMDVGHGEVVCGKVGRGKLGHGELCRGLTAWILHGFKNQYGERTGIGSVYRFYGLTGV